MRNRRMVLVVVAALLPLVLLVGFVLGERRDSGADEPAQVASAQGTVGQHTPTPTPPPATGPFDRRIARGLGLTMSQNPKLAGGFSAVVVDAATGGLVWGNNPQVGRMPASTRKTMTAFVVLSSLRTDKQLVTQVFADPAHPELIVLRGDGDPSLSPQRLDELARQVAATAKAQNLPALTVRSDASMFPAPVAPEPGTPAALVATDLAQGWEPTYLAGQVQLPRGLTMTDYRGYEAEKATGEQFAKALKAAGVTASYAGPGPVPAGAREVGQTRSEPIGRMVAIMLSRSNNDYAEFLFRQAAIARGFPGTWQGALDNERDLLGAAGIDLSGLQVYDASGLSRADRIPPQVMAQVIRQLWREPTLHAAAFADAAMPVGGVSGTLRHWFLDANNRCALGQVRAKTGNLRDVLSLAGVAIGADKTDRIFVYLDNNADAPRLDVRRALETMATTAVGCRMDDNPALPSRPTLTR